MNSARISSSKQTEDSLIYINDKDESCYFKYEDLTDFHKGDSWFGCSVAYRTMQLAARELSKERLWSRQQLSIISAHPGPGVKDAIELITHTISINNFFDLLDRINNKAADENIRITFSETKTHLSNTLWQQSLDNSFTFGFVSTPPQIKKEKSC